MRAWTSTVAGQTITALAAVVLLGGCGKAEPAKAGPVNAQAWAKSVCGAVKPWQTEIQRLQGEARQKITTKSDAMQTKVELVTLFGGMEKSTGEALNKVAKAGVPDVTDGDKIAGQFVQALTAARDSFDKGRAAVEKLPTSDKAAFDNGVASVRDAMNTENTKAGDAIGKITSPELDKALNAAPECQG
jgi:hypothetical protein